MKQQDTQPGEQSLPKPGPGDRLQTARISTGMTIEDVASKMHLSTSILTSLEENNFDDITAPIFVKGYLRAYSRLVNIDEDEIIQQYTTYYTNGDPPISKTSNTAPEINADDNRVKRISYLVILGLMVLLATWWWNRYQQAPETVSLESDNKSQTEVLAFDEASEVIQNKAQNNDTDELAVDPEQESLQLEIKTVVDSLQLEQKLAEQAAVINTQAEPAELPAIPAELQPVEVEIIEQIVAEETVAEETVADEEIAEIEIEDLAVEESTPTAIIPIPPQDDNNLLISVNADTWASIKDADGKKLVYDLLRSGDTVSVSGKAPFKAFLGNGYGVTIKYQGKNIDLNSFIKSNNTARLTIGQ